MSPEREKGDFATGSSLLDNTKSELPLQGKRERRPILQKGCDFMFKHKTKIGAVILAMVTATALLSGCGADTAKEYDKHLKPETTVSVDKDADKVDKVDDKEDSKESDKKADKADKQEDSKESSKPAKKPADKADDKDNGKKNDKPAESKPSKPANSGAVNKPSTSKPNKPNKPAPSEPAKPSKPAHQHDWQPVYTTVHHEAQYRNEPVYKDEIVYEDRPVYKWQAYWTCNGCGQRFNSENDVLDHVLFECGTGYTPHEEKVQTGTEQVQVGTNRVQVGTNQVLVKDAWDEKVQNGYTCSCGQNKK